MAGENLLEKLGPTSVEHHSPIPLYHQVYTLLKEAVSDGSMQPGELLPPEVEMAAKLGVGRQTVRQAISRLVDEGRVERFAGRGTFVREQTERARFYLDRSFTQQMSELGIHPHSKVLKITPGVIDDSAPSALQRMAGSPCLLITRLRYGDRLPIGLQETTLLTAHTPGIEQYDFNAESLYHILLSVYRLPIVRISHIVSAQAAGEIHAELLQVPTGSPLLLVKTTAYLENDQPIEATLSYYRADKYEFITHYQYRDCE